MTIFAGLDPGISGAIAFFDPANPHAIDVHDLPVAGGAVDGRNLSRLLCTRAPAFAVIEAVSAMPKQGVASTFKFGRAYGTAIGVLECFGLTIDYVHATRWKRHYRLDSDAEKSRAAALNRFPESAATFARKKDHNRAEAALLAHFAATVAFASAQVTA